LDTLITLALIAFALSKLFSKSKKQTKKTHPVRKNSSAWNTLEEMFSAESSAPAASAHRTVQRPAPYRAPATETSMNQPQRSASLEGTSLQRSFVSQLGEHSGEGRSRYGTGQSGSLQTASTEGMDYCDPSLGHDDHSTGCDVHDAMDALDQFENPDIPTLDLSWNRDSIVRAVVMQEILTRPSERIIRRG